MAGKWGEAFAFFIEQRLGAGAIEGLPHATPPVKDPTAFNTHHVVATPILWAMLTSEVTTCTQGLQAQRRDQKSLSFLAKKSVASAFAAASAPLSCAPRERCRERKNSEEARGTQDRWLRGGGGKRGRERDGGGDSGKGVRKGRRRGCA